MKRILIILMILGLVGICFGAYPWRFNIAQDPHLMDQFMSNPEFPDIETDTITMENGATWENSTNNVVELTENDESLLLTFASDSITFSTDTSAVWSFGTMIPNLDGLDVDSYVYFNPTSAPATTEGYMYYDSGTNTIKYRDDTGWVSLTSGTGDNTLDNAYDQGGDGVGKKINADTGGVEIEVADNKATSTYGLLIDYDDVTNDNPALVIESAADAANAISIDIDSQTTGRDIEGTGASFYVEGDGSVVCTDLTVGATGVILENAATITNSVDGAYKFTEGGEDFSVTLNANTMTLSTGSLMDSFAFGVIDDLEGVGTIVFDAASSSITLPSDGADDLTVQTSGAYDNHLILKSTGTSANALQILTTAGGIDVTNGGAAGGEDIHIDAVLASVLIDADEDVADAIYIHATAGGIDITADGDPGKDLDLTCTSGSVNITGGESNINSVKIAATGGVNIDAADDIDILLSTTGANQDINIQTTGAQDNHILIKSTGTSADGIGIQCLTGGIDVDAKDDLIMKVASTTTGDDMLLEQTGAQDASIHIKAAGTGADAIKLEATAGGLAVDAVDDIIITVASTTGSDNLALVQTGAQTAGITLAAAGTGDDAIDFNASAGGVDIDGVKSVTITSTEDEDDAMVINTSAGGLQITSGGVEAAEDLEITSGASLQLISTEDGVADGILIQAKNEGRIDVQGPVNLNSTFCLFEDQPIFSKWGKDATPVWGGVATGAAGDENLMMFPTASFIYHIIGTQSELGPQLRAGGFDISMDDTADEGVEITPNILGKAATGGSRQAFTAQTDAFYFKAKIYVTTVAGTDDLCVGFRKVEAFQAAVNSYSDYVLLRLNAGDIYIESDLNGAAAASDDTTDNWGNTTAVTLGVFVDSSGVVTYTIDGSAPSSTQTFTFDSGDVVVPFVYFLHSASPAALVYLQEWESGLQY